jgi:hypothetical protein
VGHRAGVVRDRLLAEGSVFRRANAHFAPPQIAARTNLGGAHQLSPQKLTAHIAAARDLTTSKLVSYASS